MSLETGWELSAGVAGVAGAGVWLASAGWAGTGAAFVSGADCGYAPL
jgi:hypothetical protein